MHSSCKTTPFADMPKRIARQPWKRMRASYCEPKDVFVAMSAGCLFLARNWPTNEGQMNQIRISTWNETNIRERSQMNEKMGDDWVDIIYIYMHITIEESNTATHVLNWGVQPTSDSKPILYCLTGPSNHNWFCSSESPVINDKSSIAHGPLYIQETHQSGYMVVGQCPVPLLFTSPTKLFWLLGCSSWFLDG